jgi:hypothetical protein
MKEVIHDLTAVIARQGEEIRSLRAQLNISSRNSSKPPSSDPPGTEKPKRKPSGRKPGGQPGHKGKTRDLLPPEEVDHFVPQSEKSRSVELLWHPLGELVLRGVPRGYRQRHSLELIR